MEYNWLNYQHCNLSAANHFFKNWHLIRTRKLDVLDFLGFFCQIDISGFYKHCTNMAPSKKEGGVNGDLAILISTYFTSPSLPI